MQLTREDIEYITRQAVRLVTEQVQTMQQPVGHSLISSKKKKDDISTLVKKHELINIEQVGPNPKCFVGFSVKEQKWYGICNDNIYGFGIKTEMHKNDCGYKYCQVRQASSLMDAHKMAMAYVREAYELERQDALAMMK